MMWPWCLHQLSVAGGLGVHADAARDVASLHGLVEINEPATMQRGMELRYRAGAGITEL